MVGAALAECEFSNEGSVDGFDQDTLVTEFENLSQPAPYGASQIFLSI